MYDDQGCRDLAVALLRQMVFDALAGDRDALYFTHSDEFVFWTQVAGVEPETVRNRLSDLIARGETKQAKTKQEDTMRKIAFLSEKGGVGKSTLCINVAAALADAGRRTLIVDLDGVACISRTLRQAQGGLLTPDITEFQDSIGAALIGARVISDVIHQTPFENLWVAPGTFELKDVEQWQLEPDGTSGRVDAQGRLLETALALEFARFAPDAFDYVLVDCPGGQPFMGRTALLACDEVVIPTGISVYDFYALTPTIEMVVGAREMRDNGAPHFLGFLPNGATARGVPKTMQERLAKYDAPVFSPVRESKMLRSSPGWRQAEKRVLVLSRPNTTVAESIRQVAREIDLGIDAAREPAEPQTQEDDHERET